jgi:hypothetical protein
VNCRFVEVDGFDEEVPVRPPRVRDLFAEAAER